MSTANGNQPPNAGPWDVVIFLARRFPAFAMMALVVAIVFFGFQLVLEQRDQARKELDAARVRIDELEDKARVALQQANSSKLQAIEALAEAKVAANEAVQAKQLDTAKRVQDLVSGQLSSMEEIEKLRISTAMTLNEEIKKLQSQRTSAERKLAQAEEKLSNAELFVSIQRLEKLNDRVDGSELTDRIEDVMDSFDLADADAVEEIEKTIVASRNKRLSAALEFAMALKTRDKKWLQAIFSRIEDDTQNVDEAWFAEIVYWSEFGSEFWDEMLPYVVAYTNDRSLPERVRFQFADFFTRSPQSWQGTLFELRDFDTREDIWQVLTFIVGVARGDLRRHLDEYDRTESIRLLATFDIAAAHVWSHVILNDVSIDGDAKRTVSRTIQRLSKDYPVLKKVPDPEVVGFWTSKDLLTERDNYRRYGTNASYSFTGESALNGN